ncbi:hypothetical protein LAZ67_22000231 [Cordylochernes scorpioides]|uniref:PUM-HD domain-containing protein n=1 Tax=Cordylochernes scorpioides TaxID=51811 RepID=A0ABY6LN74_9ARAC|nr:hypothetical protein LAZ67_22000231 [Cordylochernes scorpioides]
MRHIQEGIDIEVKKLVENLNKEDDTYLMRSLDIIEKRNLQGDAVKYQTSTSGNITNLPFIIYPSQQVIENSSATFSVPTSTNAKPSIPLDPIVQSRLRELENNLITLENITDDIVRFSKDKNGAKFLQNKLQYGTPQEKKIIFEVVEVQAMAIVYDRFGNYVFQKLLENVSSQECKKLISKLLGNVVSLAFDKFGCRVLQKALELGGLEMNIMIANELKDCIYESAKHKEAKYVIQAIIQFTNPETSEFVVNSFNGHIKELCVNPDGCRMVQWLFEHYTAEQNAILLQEFHACSATLMQDEFGNYVVQHVMEKGSTEDKLKILHDIKNHLIPLSLQKYSSNVVEKCLKLAPASIRRDFIQILCDKEFLIKMAKSIFGNYIVKTMLEVADDDQKEIVLNMLQPYISEIRKLSHGKALAGKMISLLQH